MAAEIRVDTIKSRSGINTVFLGGDALTFHQNVGIGTTVVANPISANNSGKIAVGIVTCLEVVIDGTSRIKVPVGTTAQRPGTGVAGDFRYNSDDNQFEGYSDGAWGAIGGGASETDTSVSSTSATAVYTVAYASYRSASLILQITQGSAYQVGRYLVIHDGTTAHMTEYGHIFTSSGLANFDATISSGNLLLQVTMLSAASATINVKTKALTL